MDSSKNFPKHLHSNFEFHEWKHASAILIHDFEQEWADLLDLLTNLKLPKSSIVASGGNKTNIAKWVDSFMCERGWVEKQFITAVTVDEEKMESPTHKIDCYKNRIAIELEWNNKDPFFDRDLNNFRLLFDLRAISVGIILTRSDELQGIFNSLGIGSSYGNSTTHMSKLLPRIEGGSGGGCPIIAIGMKKQLFTEND